MDNEQSRKLRALPSVDGALRRLAGLSVPLDLLTAETRRAIEEERAAILAGNNGSGVPVEERIERKLNRLSRSSLRRVINATGVILHTNLGRAPLAETEPIAGYSNLEYDLETGKRGKRDAHTSDLLEALVGRPAIVVNNNAAAVYLVLNELAAGKEAIVSRGELIEIGDGFRIPDIMARSGAILREVGTTNRTRIEDYAGAINEKTALIMRVHPSNFHVSGFTSRPGLTELSVLARERGIPVYEDLGSGCVVDLRPYGIDEPTVTASFKAGIDVLSFSGDKLLGGPQCGIVAGTSELIARIRRNPMYRAFRVDKLVIGALETTLRHILFERWDAIPAMRMIMAAESTLRERAERIQQRIRNIEALVRPDRSPIGGGSTPDRMLPTWTVELCPGNAAELERALRNASVPVVARIERDRVILDMRTVSDDEEAVLVASVNQAVS